MSDPGVTGSLSRVVVAIDGPSGSGKSSTAREVARILGLRYLDTGAMYRAMTGWMLTHGVDLADAPAVAAQVWQPHLAVGTDPAAPRIAVDGDDVSASIRGPAVTAAVSAVSAVPEVRARLVAAQRAIIGSGGIVVEGRDIGTAVAPAAAVKVFLVASGDARAVRRHAELGSDRATTTVTDTYDDLRRRDALDSTRAASPLARADDAVVIDSTHHSLDEVVAIVVDLVVSATRGIPGAADRESQSGRAGPKDT